MVIGTISQNKSSNAKQTINQMKMYFKKKLGEDWTPLIKYKNTFNFWEEQIDNDDTVGY